MNNKLFVWCMLGMMVIACISAIAATTIITHTFDQKYTENITIKDVYDPGGYSSYFIMVSEDNVEYRIKSMDMHESALSNLGKKVNIIYVEDENECLVIDMTLIPNISTAKRCNVHECGSPIPSSTLYLRL